MKRHLRKILIGLVLLVLALPFLALGAAQWYLSQNLTAEKIVSRLEAERNCRADLESVKVSLFSLPARLELKGLRLLPADKEVEKPRKDRKPPKNTDTIIAVPEAELKVNLWALLNRRLVVEDLRLERAEVKSVRKKTGENTLSLMLAKKPASESATPATEPAKPKKEPWFDVKDLAVSPALEAARVSQAHVVIRHEKKKRLVEFQGLDLSLKDLLLEGEDFLVSGKAGLLAGAKLILEDQKLEIRQLDLDLAVDGAVEALNNAAGKAENGAVLTVTIKAGSFLDRIPTLEKLARKLTKLRDNIGLDLTSFPVSGRVLEDTPLKLRVEDGHLRFAESVTLQFDTCALSVEAGSWLRLEDQEHEFKGVFTANEAVTKSSLEGVNRYLKGMDSTAARIAEEKILSRLVNGRGLLEIPYISTEDIGKPEVAFSSGFEKELMRAASEAGAELIKDALNGGDGLEKVLKGLLK